MATDNPKENKMSYFPINGPHEPPVVGYVSFSHEERLAHLELKVDQLQKSLDNLIASVARTILLAKSPESKEHP